jgi:hypothetical protein
MKVTKSQFKQIIKEEMSKIQEYEERQVLSLPGLLQSQHKDATTTIKKGLEALDKLIEHFEYESSNELQRAFDAYKRSERMEGFDDREVFMNAIRASMGEQ